MGFDFFGGFSWELFSAWKGWIHRDLGPWTSAAGWKTTLFGCKCPLDHGCGSQAYISGGIDTLHFTATVPLMGGQHSDGFSGRRWHRITRADGRHWSASGARGPLCPQRRSGRMVHNRILLRYQTPPTCTSAGRRERLCVFAPCLQYHVHVGWAGFALFSCCCPRSPPRLLRLTRGPRGSWLDVFTGDLCTRPRVLCCTHTESYPTAHRE